jgi:hypothetical protein
MKRTSVILDPKIALMAEEKHRRIFHQDMNLSDFFRHCLEAWVYSADDPRPLWQQTSEIVEQIKKDVAAQRQIVQFESAEAQEKATTEKVRMDLIKQATVTEIERVGRERFKRYLDDPNGDYSAIQDNIVAAVSKSSGYRVDLADVIAAFRGVKA